MKFTKIFSIRHWFAWITSRSFSRIIPDRLFIQMKYYSEFSKLVNFDNPKTFSEKMQYLKLYDRKSKYIYMVDKYRVREYISNIIGDEYLIPLLGVWNKFDEINFSELPNEFVLKCNHNSGGVILCHNKDTMDFEFASRVIDESLKKNFYYYGREWPYKSIEPKVICEELLYEDNKRIGLVDYKFYCFNGEPTYCQIIQNRSKDETIDFYDMEWNRMPFNGLRNLPKSTHPMKKPANYEEMTEIARKLSKGLPFLRVDLYLVNGRVFFGELTFTPTSGFGRFYPEEWNEKIGAKIQLEDLINKKQ